MDFNQSSAVGAEGETALPRLQGLTCREAAALLAALAEALHYAHAKGVVHRDIKPANIMVEFALPGSELPDLPADLGRPMILDFGLALQEEADITMTVEGQIIGTPAYMSPEQAAGRGHKADRRSDVFSLGIVLYELLCGELPFRGSRAMLLFQIQHEEPRPPRGIYDRIPRDLETICLKAMAKEPGRRYATAADCAADLRRFLKGEPILARPVGRLGRLVRWCRRHPRDAVLTGTLLGLLVVVTLLSAGAALWINHEHDLATQANRKACEAVDQMLTDVGQERLSDVPYSESVRRVLLQRARDFYEELARQRPKDPAMRKELLRAYHRLGNLHKELEERADAKKAYETAIALGEKLAAEFPHDPDYPHLLGVSHNDLGELLQVTEHASRAAEDHFAAALRIQQALRTAVPERASDVRELARTYNNRGVLYKDTDRPAPARADLTEAIQLLSALVGREPPEAEEPRPTTVEIAMLERWITDGAAPVAVSKATRAFQGEPNTLAIIRDHLRKTASEDRPFQRYFTLTHLHNHPAVTASELRLCRAAVAKLANSLSWKNSIVVPEAVDGAGTILAIDVRGLGWDAPDLWQEMLKLYPYGLKYDRAADPQLRELARDVYELAGTDLPFVRADWFVAAVSQPPLYHTVLRLPARAAELERLLRVDVVSNFQRNQLARAGFATSGVSSQNRLVERHEAAYGAYWKSYDFKSNDGRANLFRFPLGPAFPRSDFAAQSFAHDGGEIIFNLPNGLQGYLLVDRKDQRIDEAPIEVVSDALKTAGTAKIVNGLSCMACHGHGMRADFRDTVLESTGLQGGPRDKLRRLHVQPERMKRFTARQTRRAFVAPARHHFASRNRDPNLPPMGMRVRLRADYDVSAFPTEARVILTALQKYGTFLASHGPDWGLGGTRDRRWNDEALAALQRITGKDLKVVKMERVESREMPPREPK